MGKIRGQVSVWGAEKTSMEKRIDARAVLAAVAAVALGVTLVYSARTSGAQFTASTSNSSNQFWAGSIDVTTNLAQPVLLTSAGIYPGLEISECMEVSYVGTIEGVSTRMYARVGEGDLSEFLNIAIERADSSVPCAEFEPTSQVFEGTLAAYAGRYHDFASGYDLNLGNPGETATLRIVATVADDNAAQGLSTDFSFFLEGRP